MPSSSSLYNASVSSQEPFSALSSTGWYPATHSVDSWLTGAYSTSDITKLSASPQELAKEMLESLLGYEGKGGHKPPRPDIQKMKDVWDLQQKTFTLQENP